MNCFLTDLPSLSLGMQSSMSQPSGSGIKDVGQSESPSKLNEQMALMPMAPNLPALSFLP